MSYAWIIDQDHLWSQGADYDSAGMMGPSAAPDWMTDALQATTGMNESGYNFGAIGHANVEQYRFSMYDDDGIKYVTGRMLTDEGKTEDACYGPLGDYGMPGLGCVVVKYHGHPEMDCG